LIPSEASGVLSIDTYIVIVYYIIIRVRDVYCS
jgi:hypothetical protein